MPIGAGVEPQMLYNLMQSSKGMGMQTMDDALMKLVRDKTITQEN